MRKLPIAVDNHWKSLGRSSDPNCHEWQRGHHIDTLARDSGDAMNEDVAKTYKPRGILQQIRYEKLITFTCSRCGGEKKSKLVAFYEGDQSKRLCNGCYGYLLSTK